MKVKEYYGEPCIEIWQFFLILGQIMAIDNLRKHLSLAVLIFILFFILARLASGKFLIEIQKAQVDNDSWNAKCLYNRLPGG
jgi:hypothetical protein